MRVRNLYSTISAGDAIHSANAIWAAEFPSRFPHRRAAYHDHTTSQLGHKNSSSCTTVAIASVTSLLLGCKILRPNVLTPTCRKGRLEMIHRTEYPSSSTVQHVGVYHGGLDVSMSK